MKPIKTASDQILSESLLSTTSVGSDVARVEVHHLEEGVVILDFRSCHKGAEQEALGYLQTYMISHYSYPNANH